MTIGLRWELRTSASLLGQLRCWRSYRGWLKWTRHALWTEHPRAVIYVLDEVVCWPEGRPDLVHSSTASHRYCWVVWKPGHAGRRAFWWIRAGEEPI